MHPWVAVQWCLWLIWTVMPGQNIGPQVISVTMSNMMGWETQTKTTKKQDKTTLYSTGSSFKLDCLKKQLFPFSCSPSPADTLLPCKAAGLFIKKSNRDRCNLWQTLLWQHPIWTSPYFLWPVGRVVAGFESEGGHLRSAGGVWTQKSRPWLTASKETGSSNLQLQTTGLCKQSEWDSKNIFPEVSR